MQFANRRDAGRQLGVRLAQWSEHDPVVIGLPRGGIPVAFEVAGALHAPLDVLVIRKLGYPQQPELGVGAIGEGGIRILNEPLLRRVGVSKDELHDVERAESAILQERIERLRAGHPVIDVQNRTVIVVDDGLATGFTARAAIEILRRRGARRVIVAVPVAPRKAVEELEELVEEVVCLQTPADFRAIGLFYEDFTQITDEQVAALLAESPEIDGADPSSALASSRHESVIITAADARLHGALATPPRATGIVLFAHGSGSSRHSSRNRQVSRILQSAGFATLLMDLLTDEESRRRDLVFDVDLLAERIVAATKWIHQRLDLTHLPLGYFGASTGAAASLGAAARQPDDISAVVSRGGRPDLAGSYLSRVAAPTLFIVGSADEMVLAVNRQAQRQLHCLNELAVIADATHLFPEPGALEQVATLARNWFAEHLVSSGTSA